MAFLWRRRKDLDAQHAQQQNKMQDKLTPPPEPPLTAATTATSEASAAAVEEAPAKQKEKEGVQAPAKEKKGGEMEALDICFVVDCTGSMASYIAAAQRNVLAIIDGISQKGQAEVRFGLIQFRDHPPQESTYVTRVFEFTADVAQIKAYVDTMAAVGGGDGPEAVADALYEVLYMEWRPSAAKVAVLITDAPPHGLGEACDGFPQGCPAGHDPLALARACAGRGITIYTVGCEPALSAFFAAKDFLISLAELTSGMALRLESSALLAEVILGSAVEELALMRLQREVAREVQAGLDQGLSEATVVAHIEGTLRSRGTRCAQLKTTLRLHPDAAPHARAISASASMAEARSHVARAVEAAGRGDSSGVAPMAGAGGAVMMMRSASVRSITRDGMVSDDSACATSCCSVATPMVAACAMPMPPPPPPPPAPSSSGFGPLISGLLSRRGGAHHPSPAVERGSSWGPSQKWMAAAAPMATTTSPVAAADASVSDLAVGVAGLEVAGSGDVEVCEDAEVSTDQILRLVRKAKSLRQQDLVEACGKEEGKEAPPSVEEGEGEQDWVPILSGVGVASAKTL